MALPTKTNLETMDYSYGGVPFVSVAAKSGIDLDTLDYSYAGVPFWGLEVSGGGPQSYTLTCAAGSYSLTGTNAGLTVTRHYTLSVGGAYPDIAVSGAGTTAVNGTYAEYGTLNGKTRYRMASTASGTGYFYIVWYVNAWFISIRGEDGDAFIQIQAGARYRSTDNVATPDLVTTWLVSQGIVPVPTVTIATTYTLTGSDATLTVQRNYTLVCEPGSYTYTGTDITFGNTKSYTLVCASGSYSLTGSDVSFAIQRNYTFACEAGSYTLTGTDATLSAQFHYTLSLEAGTYSLTGTNAGLTSARTMALESGSYTLTGTNADLYRALVMACEAGSYALTGTDASLTSHRIFALGMGSYVLVGTACGLFILSPTPACRTYTIDAEGRLYAIPAESREYDIPYENRTLEVKC